MPCSLALLLVVRQHSLLPLDTLTEAVLERGVTFAFLDVSCDGRANDVRNRLTVDGRDRVQLLGLVGGQADGHLRADDVIEIAEVLVEETDLGETGAHYYHDLDAEYQDLDAEAELTRELAGAEEQEKEEWFSKAADLERQVEELRAGLAKKEEELQEVRQNWRLTLSADQANGSGGSESAEEPLLVDVLGAVEHARLRFGTRLHFLPEAINSAGESTFLYPAKVYGALEALDQLAEAREAGPLGKSVKD